MPKLVNLNMDKVAFTGMPHEVELTLDLSLLEGNASVDWAGVRLLSIRPCKKEILIAISEIFGNGILESGTYIRRKKLNISKQVVPTIKERDIKYVVRGTLRLKKDDGSEENFFDEQELEITSINELEFKSRPINMQIKNIKVSTEKDVYKKGEIVKLRYELENVKNLKINLVKNANISCKCHEYEKCVYIKPKPPQVIKTLDISNPPSEDVINFELPDNLETSHNWKWIGTSKSYFEYSLGDIVLYTIELIATTTDNEIVNIQAPIIIAEDAESMLFSSPSTELKRRPFETIFPPKNIEIEDVTISGKEAEFTLKNKSNNKLEGVTITIKGIMQALFETNPWTIGKKEWNPGEKIIVTYKNHNKSIESYQLLIETNSGIQIEKSYKL